LEEELKIHFVFPSSLRRGLRGGVYDQPVFSNHARLAKGIPFGKSKPLLI